MDNPVTVTTILDWLRDGIEQKRVIDAHTWVDAAQKLNILQTNEHDKLYVLKQQVALARVLRIKQGESVAKSRTIIESTDIYREMKNQEARIEMIQEMIRLAKLQARLKDNEYRSQ